MTIELQKSFIFQDIEVYFILLVFVIVIIIICMLIVFVILTLVINPAYSIRAIEIEGNLLNFHNYNVLYIYLHNFFLDKSKDYSLYSVNGSFIGDGRNVFISNTFF